MISIADLNELRHRPQPDYPEYEQVRAEARRRSAGPVNPAALDGYRDVLHRRSRDWVWGVLGWHAPQDLRQISCLEADMLMVADEQDLDPPLPGILQQWLAESAELQARPEEARQAGLRRDQERWDTARAQCQVPVEVRPNVNTGIRGGRREALRHVIPLVDARSGKRLHRAGRGLCEVRHSRQFGEPTSEPATCISCLAYTPQLREA